MTEFICPAPLRQIGKAYLESGSFSACLNKLEFQKNAMRLSIAASECLIAYQMSFSLPTIAITGSILSVPAAVIAGGSFFLYEAVSNVFSNVIFSVICAVAGWTLLEYYDRFAMGCLEMLFVETQHPKSDERNLEFSDLEQGVYGAKTIVDSGKLGQEEIVEFFYSRTDTGENALKQGSKVTFGGKVQFDYEIFANTAKSEVEIDGEKWVTREHYFQAQKFNKGSSTYRAIREASGVFADPRSLRSVTRNEAYRDDWDEKEAFETLYRANLAFFKQNETARQLLLSTGRAPIVERNDFPDCWGITFRPGPISYRDQGEPINRNYQGLILMKVRKALRK